MRISELPSQDFLKDCFQYDPETGDLIWKERPASHFETENSRNRFRTMYSGKAALTAHDEDGYLVGSLRCNGCDLRLKAHRVIFKMMTGTDPAIVDHKNGIRDDNRWDNIREATHWQNTINAGASKGVALKWVKRSSKNRYCARVTDSQGKRRELGNFLTAEEAHAAAVAFARADYGAFFPARTEGA